MPQQCPFCTPARANDRQDARATTETARVEAAREDLILSRSWEPVHCLRARRISGDNKWGKQPTESAEAAVAAAGGYARICMGSGSTPVRAVGSSAGNQHVPRRTFNSIAIQWAVSSGQLDHI
ncbi:unnamed protein product [Nezara viridula]|uniref:Uncharacterized protein n=1 Tax=Nezara viridula TaxID=85310 RepID=A0A9P0HEU8_NEZVI|nr:unnamed protein product [Nezara viridula]